MTMLTTVTCALLLLVVGGAAPATEDGERPPIDLGKFFTYCFLTLGPRP